jgi:hypothetical protein
MGVTTMLSYQAITTKYLGPTNRRGSRVKATTAGGDSLTLTWDDALNSDTNHASAAQALAANLDWSGKWYAGGLKTGMVFVSATTGDDCAFIII